MGEVTASFIKVTADDYLLKLTHNNSDWQEN